MDVGPFDRESTEIRRHPFPNHSNEQSRQNRSQVHPRVLLFQLEDLGLTTTSEPEPEQSRPDNDAETTFM